MEFEPMKFVELHLRLDHDLLTSRHVGGYLKVHPLMKSRTSRKHLVNAGTIYSIIGLSSV